MSDAPKIYGYLQGVASQLQAGGGHETWEQGYRQGYRNAVNDVLEYIEDEFEIEEEE